MHSTQLFELVIAMFLAIIALHFLAARLRLPASAGLIAGGAMLAFVPGLPSISVDPDLVLVIFLPPLLMDGAWSIAVGRLRRHAIGIASLAVGAVFFSCAVVAVAMHLLFPALPIAACAALGAIVAPPDAVAARAVLQRFPVPRHLQILLEGESLLNDASGLVLFRFAIAAGVTGMFSVTAAAGTFAQLAIGGFVIGVAVATAWVRLVRRLGDENLVIAATVLLSWTSYLLGEALHVSGVIATVTTGMIASWHQHRVLTATMRMRGTAFWAVMVFLMEAVVFVLIGLSLRDIVGRGGGFAVVAATMGWQILAVLAALTLARFAWVFASDAVGRVGHALHWTRSRPLGVRGATVLGWAGVRGVVSLALALSVPAGFPGRDEILVISFAVILVTVLVQGTTLGRVIAWAGLSEPAIEQARVSMGDAEAALAKAQLAAVERMAYDDDGKLIHPKLLDQYQRRASAVARYAQDVEGAMPGVHAHFDVILAAVAEGRRELARLHQAGDIDDETRQELERDLDLEELSAISAKG